jgi:hypothetical protein
VHGTYHSPNLRAENDLGLSISIFINLYGEGRFLGAEPCLYTLHCSAKKRKYLSTSVVAQFANPAANTPVASFRSPAFSPAERGISRGPRPPLFKLTHYLYAGDQAHIFTFLQHVQPLHSRHARLTALLAIPPKRYYPNSRVLIAHSLEFAYAGGVPPVSKL